MLADFRDVLANLRLEAKLRGLRREHLERVIENRDIPPDFWEAGEQAALSEIQREFYNPKIQTTVDPHGHLPAASEQAWEQRTGQPMTEAILDSHRRIREAPVHGDPRYKRR